MSDHALHLELGDGHQRVLVVRVPDRLWHSPLVGARVTVVDAYDLPPSDHTTRSTR